MDEDNLLGQASPRELILEWKRAVRAHNPTQGAIKQRITKILKEDITKLRK